MLWWYAAYMTAGKWPTNGHSTLGAYCTSVSGWPGHGYHYNITNTAW